VRTWKLPYHLETSLMSIMAGPFGGVFSG
jgi:hypothetical protein